MLIKCAFDVTNQDFEAAHFELTKKKITYKIQIYEGYSINKLRLINLD